MKRKIIATAAVAAIVAGAIGVLGAPAAHAAYAANGEPVWIPRNATNTADLLRADNRALAKIGNVLYLGGDFTELAPELGAPAVQQANLAAFNATTGVPIASFAPQLDGKVYAMLADATTNTLYVGGSFTGGLAILDATTGQPKETQLTTDGEVHALYRDGNSMYVGGQFQKVQRLGVNTSRKMMARFDVGTLAVDPTFAPAFVGGMVDAIDISPDHTRLYAGGRFTTLNGTTVGKVVALNQTTGALDTSFNPPFNTTKQPVEDIEALNTKVFVAFGGGYNRFVQFNATSGAQEYGSCGDGDVQEVHLVNGGSVLLVGGHFAGNPKKNCTLDTIPTARIAEYQVNDVAGSLPTIVNPTPFSNVYANELGVWEFLGDSLGDIWVAGDFLKVSSRNTGGLAHFLDGTTYVDAQVPSTPGNVQVTAPSPGGFTVSWSPSTDNKGVAGYYVLVDAVRRATSLGTSAVVAGLDPGVTSTVQVQAFDVKLNLSTPSAGVPGTTLSDTVPPSVPTNLRVLNGSTSELVLGWNAAVDDGTVTQYQVYADGALLGTTAGLSLAHSGLAAGSQHTYQVTAKDAGGNVSPPSATLTARAYSVVLPARSTWKYRDLGALPDFAWREAAYDDSSWSSGKAPLGYGKADITSSGTTIGWGPNNSNRYLTSYARTTFNLPDPSGITGMALRLRGTDGAAVFVNGRLVENDNLPAALEPDLGALTARDTAALDTTREYRVPVPAGMLVAGANVVAVEFHKYAPNSTYLAFDTEISLGLVSSSAPPPLPPGNVTATVVAGPAVQLTWDAVSGATGYVVLRGGVQVATPATPGFTDATPPAGAPLSYTVRTVDGLGRTSNDSTAATVDVTPPSAPGNLVATVVSGPAVQLTWDAVSGATGYVVLRGGVQLGTPATPGFTDPSPGTGTISYTVRAVDAIGQQSSSSSPATVTISGSPKDTTAPSVPGKPVLVAGSLTDTAASFTWPASADDVGVTGYRIFRDGVDVGTSPTTSFAATGLTASTLYKFQVAAFDAAGNQSAKSSGLKLTTTAPASGGALNLSTTWSYTDVRADPGPAWSTPAFDASTWKTGQPQFGFGDGDEKTVLDHGGATTTTGVITWYFRTTFDVPDPAAIGALLASLVRDDGVAVYVNGVEVFRNNLPGGPLTFTTKASSSLGGTDETNPITFTIPASALIAGTNVIAVELHNAGPVNADASFQLTGALG